MSEDSESIDTGEQVKAVWHLLDSVMDPEVPVVSVVDLGVIRDITSLPGGGLEVSITPTYTGCPATLLIEEMVKAAIESAGHQPVTIRRTLSPPWTTDWISDKGRAALNDYGIAPPVGQAGGKASLFGHDTSVSCPRCGAADTEMVSEFGSTACKAFYRCQACQEPFEYFKCI